ncbi:hypothetical protein CFK37_09585 [Virgibacillus phasianinus]|uniref:Transcriptional regulator n=1 Tax=Virgibacillus phasianinus TaxID=2017483 RepID=A0A220U2N6_9BACI|nr:hypothetical protein [Virgibacillus phasianinus]ASK62389.1 hypothetical protein CFK37_09585 [Virgibacillus phasianinus]
MYITIGVIGPKESVSRILRVAKDFPAFEFKPFIYQEVSEIEEILKSNGILVDQWLFSGIMNYSLAIEREYITPDEGSYPTLHGSSFFGILMEAQLNEGKIFRNISIDAITNEEMAKVMSFYKLDSLTYYNEPYEGYYSLENFPNFHKSLYQDGKTEVAITALKSTYEELKKEGIPVYRLTPSYISIKVTIQLLLERAQANRYENLQMAVVGCKVVNEINENEAYDLFKWKHHELDIKKSLMHLTEIMNGSFVDVGDGLYFIFTTKGEMDDEAEKNLFHFINEFRLRDQLSIGVVIGYGENVSHAEQNVRYGLSSIKPDERAPIVVIDEQQSATIKYPNNESAPVNLKHIEQVLRDRFGEAINIRDAVRLIIYSHKYNKQAFTSQDISRWLQSTERNGRRILTNLENANVIQKCGTSHAKQKGRPKIMYQFAVDIPLSP